MTSATAAGLAGLSACLVTLAIAWPLARRLAAFGFVDHPNHRSMHSEAVPRGGGAGMAVAATVVTVACVVSGLDSRALTLVALAVGLSAVGFADDRFNLPASPRLAAQVALGIAAVAIVRDSGWSDETAWPLGITAAVVVVWVMGCCNAVNFMDGVTALTGMNAIVFGGHLVVVGHDDALIRVPAAIVVGASAGFLYWNWIRRRMFLGDGGAYFLGALLALLVTLAAVRTVAPLVAAAPFAVYAADTSTAIVKRLARSADLADGHREHVYQRLVLSGRGHVEVALFTAACSAACAMAAIAVDRGPLPPGVGAAIVVGVVALYLSAPRWAPPATDSAR